MPERGLRGWEGPPDGNEAWLRIVGIDLCILGGRGDGVEVTGRRRSGVGSWIAVRGTSWRFRYVEFLILIDGISERRRGRRERH